MSKVEKTTKKPYSHVIRSNLSAWVGNEIAKWIKS